MTNLISGLVKKTLRTFGLGGGRRHTKKGGAYLLRPRPMVRPPTPASSEPRRRRKTKAKKGGDEDEKMSFAPMQTRKAGRRHRSRKGGNHAPGHMSMY